MSLNVYYDLKYAPATFDFAHFLSFSNAVRQDLKSNDMSINIICEQFRQKSTRDKLLEVSERKWRVNHILLKLANLIPEVSSVTVNSGYLSEKKIDIVIIKAIKKQHKIYILLNLSLII